MQEGQSVDAVTVLARMVDMRAIWHRPKGLRLGTRQRDARLTCDERGRGEWGSLLALLSCLLMALLALPPVQARAQEPEATASLTEAAVEQPSAAGDHAVENEGAPEGEEAAEDERVREGVRDPAVGDAEAAEGASTASAAEGADATGLTDVDSTTTGAEVSETSEMTPGTAVEDDPTAAPEIATGTATEAAAAITTPAAETDATPATGPSAAVPATSDPSSDGEAAAATAATAATAAASDGPIEFRFAPGGAADNQALLDAYAQQYLNEQLPATANAPRRAPRIAHLSGLELEVYNALKAQIAKVAAGQRSSTVFAVTASSSWPTATLAALDINNVLSELLANCPYELYWFDKTTSSSCTWSGRTYTFRLCVAAGYRGAGTYVVNTATGTRVRAAVANAKRIVSASAGGSSHKRLKAYMDHICKLVDYDTKAASNRNAKYGDPWQLISVFDGDRSTNVVCEGYAKAFQYLCDLSNFSGVYCYTVTGAMWLSGGLSEGHMWNVVSMADGSNYLVDVTNCDAGSIGAGGKLFLRSYSSGSVAAGYAFAVGSNTVHYRYDGDALRLYKASELAISKNAYRPASARGSLAGATVSGLGPMSYTGGRVRPRPVVTLFGGALKRGTDYTLSYKNNVRVGTATVIITGTGAYQGTRLTRTFKIVKAKNPLSAKVKKGRVRVSVSALRAKARTIANNIKVRGAQGRVRYRNVSRNKVARHFKVNGRTGRVTIPKRTKAGTYQVRVRVSAAGNGSYRAASRVRTFKVVIR